MSISTASLPSGQVGFPYGATLAVTGGTAPYSWSLMAGTLPTGLSFNTSTGMINGTPMVSVSQASLTFQVKDSGNPQETRTATLALTVTVAAPTITSLSTTSGPVGAAVTITGSNFGSSQGSSTVTFNGTAATATNWSATSISVTVPVGATSGNVVVTVSGQASNGIAFTATFPAPSITSLSVNSGPVGTPVTITGSNFGSSQGSSTVTFNGAAATPTSWSATSISVTVPAGATSGNVVVTVSGQASNGIAFTATFPAPSITSLSVNSGSVGTPVTITGSNFGSSQGSSTVTFNGAAATPTSWSATSISVTVPAGATSGNVVVTVSGQASNGIAFTATFPAPSITSLSVNSGPVGTPVTITGANFGSTQGTSTVTFNGAAATPTSWSATSISVTVPAGATSGNVVVTVSGHASNGIAFTVTVPAPSITSLSVNSGPVGTPVTITGANFGSTQGTSTVTSNGAAATPTNWSATSISVTVPAGATSGNVVVTVSGHASNGIAFTVTSGGPISVSVTPLRGGATIAQQIQMTATVTNDVGNAGVMWVVSSGGTLTGQTTVAAAFSAATAGVYTVTAMSVANPGATATATFGVTNLAGVFTYHNDLSRDGNNSNEYALTTANVTSSTFGKLFSCTVDGAVYAQPLWAANIMINGVKRNVVFVATQHDSLYAFDADVNTTPCTPLWQVNLIDSAHGGSSSETSVPSGPSGNLVGGGAGDITPEVGITGTPVIDPSTNILYVVSKSVIASGPTFFQRLHAIDLTTGNERSGSPVTITGTFPGTGDGGTTDTFSPRQQNQRPGLALVNGVVYIAWASHEDRAPYYGWVIGYNVSNLSQSAVLNVTPNAGYGGIWMGGGAPAADSSNNLYLITGNGRFDATNTSGPTNDYGDSFLRLSPGLTVSSYFTPSDQASDDANDSDFGSGGAAMLVDQPSSPVRHLVIGGGKDGALYLLNRDALGGPGDSNALQRFTLGSGGGIFATGAFWNNTFYIAAAGSPVEAFSFNVLSGKFNTSSTSQSPNGFGFPGATPSVSASGTTNGIVWALDGSQYCTNGSGSRCGPAVLHAYDAINLATELWNSQGTGNAAGNAVKFTVPTIANGKVYVGTRGNNTGGDHGSTSVSGELDVYGLLPN